MDIGLNVVDGLRIKIGETVDQLKESLNNMGIDYNVYDGEIRQGKKQSIFLVSKYGLELGDNNGYITMVKINNLKINTIFNIKELEKATPSIILQEIILKVSEIFSVERRKLSIERFNGRTYSTIVLVDVEDGHSVRIDIQSNDNYDFQLKLIELV